MYRYQLEQITPEETQECYTSISTTISNSQNLFIPNIFEPPSPKDQRPNLNTLPPLRSLRRPRVLKGRMRHPRPLGLRIKTLQQQPLLILHTTPIEPFLALTVLHAGRLACAIRIPMLNRHEIVIRHAVRGREAERERLNGPVKRPPDVYDPVAAL